MLCSIISHVGFLIESVLEQHINISLSPVRKSHTCHTITKIQWIFRITMKLDVIYTVYNTYAHTNAHIHNDFACKNWIWHVRWMGICVVHRHENSDEKKLGWNTLTKSKMVVIMKSTAKQFTFIRTEKCRKFIVDFK